MVKVIRMIVIGGGITTIITIKWALWKFIAWVEFVGMIELKPR
jgi:hypothetical protein